MAATGQPTTPSALPRGFGSAAIASDGGAGVGVSFVHFRTTDVGAFATWAHGYDPGEPLNTEEIRVKVREGGRSAFVSYRNRVTEVNVPPPDEFPQWEA